MSIETSSAKELFLAAVEIQSPAEQIVFLARSCAENEPLRRRVEALLNAHERPESVLDHAAHRFSIPPLSEEAPLLPSVIEGPGTVIGPYKLLEQIGEGGFGVVFMAEQKHPVRRNVALKVIKPGMDTKEVIARFEAERQALALMEHPNITKVLDAGETDGGRPYFVMELVRGVPITDYCEQNRLAPRERLELFVSVCAAVQHAHHKGIIHRDLKPTNVLVTLHGETPVATVIDFGIAKAIGQQLTNRTLCTGAARMIGSPLYMSPEQAEMSGLDIDTRSDIYSLGILLFELLTGTTPFDQERFKSAGFDEMRRIIREEEPEKVSTRLAKTRKTGTRDARRGIIGKPSKSLPLVPNPESLTPRLSEIDWIVAKALEKDRRRRYETASALAADVQRHLNNEPVAACPASMLYRIRKYASRNKAAFATTAVLVVATVFSTWQAIRATKAESLATRRLQAEAAQRKRADDARREAVANLNKAREAVDRMLTRAAQERLLHVPQMEPVRRQLLQDALEFYEGFLRDSADDPSLSLETAQAYGRLAYISRALGRVGEAESALRQAIELLEKLSTETTLDRPTREALCEYYSVLGNTLALQGSRTAAEPFNRRALEYAAQLAQEFGDSPQHRRRLAQCYLNLSETLKTTHVAEAQSLLTRAIALVQDESSDQDLLAIARASQGSLLMANGKAAPAVALLRQAVEFFEQRRAAQTSAWPEGDCELGEVQLCLAGALAASGKRDEAEKCYRQAVAGFEALAKAFPNASPYRRYLARCHRESARLLRAGQRHQEALESLERALALFESLAGEFDAASGELARSPEFSHGDSFFGGFRPLGEIAGPAGAATAMDSEFASRALYLAEIIQIHLLIGAVLDDEDRLLDAELARNEAAAVQQRLENDVEQHPLRRTDVARVLMNLAYRLQKDGLFTDAEQPCRTALRHFAHLVDESPADSELIERLAGEHFRLGRILAALGRVAEAINEYRSAAPLYGQLAVDGSRKSAFVFAQASSLNNAAWLLANAQDTDARDAGQAVEAAGHATELAPTAGDFWNTLGAAHHRAGDFRSAIAAFERSIKLRNGGDAFDWLFLAMAHARLDERDTARQWFDKAVTWIDMDRRRQDEELSRLRKEAEQVLDLKESTKPKE